MSNKSEVWLRGPLNNMPVLLQPVAHALLSPWRDCRINASVPRWIIMAKRHYGIANIPFTAPGWRYWPTFCHAKGEHLDQQQLNELAAEGKRSSANVRMADLVTRFNLQVDKAIDQLCKTDETTPTAVREVGRVKLPSTVIDVCTRCRAYNATRWSIARAVKLLMNNPLE